jgi:large subunit ribosomal protein L6
VKFYVKLHDCTRNIMSRVAKAPVVLPSNVELTLAKGEFTVKGPKGILKKQYNKLVVVTKDNESNIVRFAPVSGSDAWYQAGTVRAKFNNMVIGVSDGFTKTLELVGVGYRAQVNNNVISLSLGFTHPIIYKLPEGISAETPSNTILVLRGIDKELLGKVAAEIRSFRPPEPYKGKGVKYAGEHIARKDAKKK